MAAITNPTRITSCVSTAEPNLDSETYNGIICIIIMLVVGLGLIVSIPKGGDKE